MLLSSNNVIPQRREETPRRSRSSFKLMQISRSVSKLSEWNYKSSIKFYSHDLPSQESLLQDVSHWPLSGLLERLLQCPHFHRSVWLQSALFLFSQECGHSEALLQSEKGHLVERSTQNSRSFFTQTEAQKNRERLISQLALLLEKENSRDDGSVISKHPRSRLTIHSEKLQVYFPRTHLPLSQSKWRCLFSPTF